MLAKLLTYNCGCFRPRVVCLLVFGDNEANHAQKRHGQNPEKDYLEQPAFAVEKEVEPHEHEEEDEEHEDRDTE